MHQVPAAPEQHIMPGGYFSALSVGLGGSEIIRFLWRTERSRRLLVVATLFNEVERDPRLLGRLPAGDTVLQAFAEAQHRAAAEIDALLLDPQVGGWAAYALRRRRSGVTATDETPLWVDLGGLHVLALAAAARAGLAWRTRLPHREGRVMLFGLGMATFHGLAPDDLIDAETADGLITLRGRGETATLSGKPSDEFRNDDHWWGLRHLTVGDSPRLTVSLDDLDPFRDLADPIRPERLTNDEAASWQALLDEAWHLLHEYHRDTADALATGFVSLVPLPVGDGWETRSASSGEAFGRIMVSPPPDALTLAVSLVHEFQHIKLGGLMHLTSLVTDDGVPRYYAPWRDDPRPIGGHIQGIYAFFGIAAFWRRHRETVSGLDARVADFEYAYARAQTLEGLRVVLDSGRLTEHGRELIEGLTSQVETWLQDRLATEAREAARTVLDHHRTGWRIRHHRLRADEVDMLLCAWNDNERVIVDAMPPDIRPSQPVRWSHRMLGLTRRHILEPDTWRKSIGQMPWAAGVSPGDIALLGGDIERARPLYADSVRGDHRNVDAWCGLALTLDRLGSKDAARVLAERPELVRALYGGLVGTGLSPAPEDVASWLGEALASSSTRA